MSVLLINALIIFTGSTKRANSETEAFTSAMHVVKYKADLEKTVITWIGKKVGSEHTGTINLKDGYILNDHGNINNGKFVIDMSSINNTDLEDESMKGKLEGHLHSADFFNTSEFPEAVLKLKSIKPLEGVEGMTNSVVADLTIKGITHTIEMPANISWESNNMFVYAAFSIDRTKWDIKYNSKSFFESIGDKFIYDEVDFTVRTQLSASR